jgi:hypothetical protein
VLYFGIKHLIKDLILLIEAFASRSWPYTEGKIVFNNQYQVEEAVSYDLQIKYIYVVQGKKYLSKRVTLFDNVTIGLPSDYPIDRERKIEKYYTGSTVKVFYNSRNHKKSVLEQGINYWFLFALSLQPFFLIIIPIFAQLWIYSFFLNFL